ncbi:hypothetical protein SAMN02745216_03293 [Desulfatibacillum alkenivorans DSM 16219]|jgi:hypothetical protein|uniref:Outer membrane protein beta-barrel domain-containing protein n=1 Tax=Desulfatibacillum alkenivorans DSM 16219 TaxID=1121393 RepID=A0A1M6RLL9_9BACT|nr:hypothetical protein [Desulfatibacillum alkenivorans]SHK33352.1 hypothetical protein SAMN02745216_03293 [Desulfatibacillum alkenivorans DSM 16219]
MKIRGGIRFTFTALIIALLLGLWAGSAAAAEKFSRLDKWEYFAMLQYNGEDTVRTYVPAYDELRAYGTVEQEAEASYGGGFGVGKTVTDYLNINGTFFYNYVDLINRGSKSNTFQINSSEAFREIYCTSHHWTVSLNAEGYLFSNNFPGTALHLTPMIMGGVGTRYIHGQWGRTNLKIRDYILTTTAGVGLRWDFSSYFVKALYQSTWYRMTDTEDSYQTKGYTCQFGCAF